MKHDDATRFTTHWIQAQPTVFAFVSAALSSYSDAEDVVQKVATVAIAKFSDYDESRPFVNWCIGLARFEILRYLRDRGTDRHRYVTDSLGAIVTAFEETAPDLDERRRALSVCLKQLTGRPREVLEKRYGDGLKTGAIAEAMRLAANSVSRILNRTYSSLRDCIGRKLTTEGGP